MKAITFKNRFNGERVVCKDVKDIQVIDGIEYLLVSKTIQDRKFLMRKDALEKVNASVVQWKIHNPTKFGTEVRFLPGAPNIAGIQAIGQSHKLGPGVSNTPPATNQWCQQCSGLHPVL